MTAPTQARPIHVAVAHRDPYVAAGIASLLRSRAGFVVQSGLTDVDGGGAVDVLVTDYATGVHKTANVPPGPGGSAPGSFLVVTDQSTGWQIRRAVDAGVRGYLLHDCSAEELSEAVRCVAEGRRYLSCPVADQLLDNLSSAVPTARELEVLRLMAQGLANKDIGRRLGIGEGTVKAHVKAILRKLRKPTRVAAIGEAFRCGLLLEASP
ncbi:MULTISPECIES: response regulator transcription factor [Variovorax]|jgi:DNA-binding NarL/FixJ family response regulator|uniref:Transcriptional regulator, LuxR family n=1 Tax=Variovorax paradoxus (strain S110) TaxID=543728 RepID=C5CZM2_VARPS|nr:response regulator transcription factor [Variovorax paradoxus]MBW8715697.1 response regulator transcription factor [Variovorax paradoxus]MBW8892380.1 response regulator transcription factor [Burkholderiales bacterium]